MTFDWLKTLLGDAYTEDIDKTVATEIGKRFTAKADFEAKSTDCLLYTSPSPRD